MCYSEINRNNVKLSLLFVKHQLIFKSPENKHITDCLLKILKKLRSIIFQIKTKQPKFVRSPAVFGDYQLINSH